VTRNDDDDDDDDNNNNKFNLAESKTCRQYSRRLRSFWDCSWKE
jgi:hypothetical protein